MKSISLGYVTDSENLGLTLRLLRMERKLRLADVAPKVGTSITTLSTIERGTERTYMSVEFTLKLLDFYGVRLKLEDVSDD